MLGGGGIEISLSWRPPAHNHSCLPHATAIWGANRTVSAPALAPAPEALCLPPALFARPNRWVTFPEYLGGPARCGHPVSGHNVFSGYDLGLYSDYVGRRRDQL